MSRKAEEKIDEIKELEASTKWQEKVYGANPGLIKELVEKKAVVKIVEDEDYGHGFEIGGFYGIYTLLLPKDSGKFLCITRQCGIKELENDRKLIIESFEDLTRENHYIWARAKTDENPSKIFLKTMLNLKLIEVEKEVVIYKSMVSYQDVTKEVKNDS